MTGGRNSPTAAEKGKSIQNELLDLVDEDTTAFNRILEATGLPKRTEEEKKIRRSAIQEATKNAASVPFKVMETALSGFALLKEMVEEGNPNSVSDAAVGALALRSCIRGAFLNVKINAAAIEDKEFVASLIEKGSLIESGAAAEEEEILRKAETSIQNSFKIK